MSKFIVFCLIVFSFSSIAYTPTESEKEKLKQSDIESALKKILLEIKKKTRTGGTNFQKNIELKLRNLRTIEGFIEREAKRQRLKEYNSLKEEELLLKQRKRLENLKKDKKKQ